MEKLYTGKQIAEMYGVSPYTVANNWAKNGLKHIRGPGNSFLYRINWVEEYIQSQIIENDQKYETEIVKINKIRKTNRSENKYIVV